MKYFLSFIEEFGFNPKYKDYIFGRVEIYANDDDYASDEIRFMTKDLKGFQKFRDKWDFMDVSEEELETFKTEIAQFQEE